MELGAAMGRAHQSNKELWKSFWKPAPKAQGTLRLGGQIKEVVWIEMPKAIDYLNCSIAHLFLYFLNKITR